MHKIWRLIAASLCIAFFINTAVAQDQPIQEKPISVTHDNDISMMKTSHFDLQNNLDSTDSKSDKSALDSYRVFVAVPNKTAPKEGWPVIWLLDGNMTFDYAVKYAPDALIIGIGYPIENRDEIVARRYFDLTEKADPTSFVRHQGQTPPNTGGRAAFSRFIMDEIRPFIKKQYEINDNEHVLYGHSLGGLFVLHEMLDGRARYNIYCAADPSIWWSKHGILERFKKEPLFADDNSNKQTHLLISASGKRAERKQLSAEDAKKINETRGGPNGKYVFDLLQNYPFLDEHYQVYENDSHGTMVEPSVHDCLKFAKIKLNHDD